ncbi:MAG: amidohydrolase [Chloroflexi bacterium]|nr:amidohydrolase [Chloroflexota bacterium]
MKQVDLVLTNAIVLTMDKDMNLYEPGAVAVDGQYIIAAGPENEILQAYSGKTILDCHGKVLMPGLINGHTHAPMTLLRGLADDLRLDVWLMGYMMPVENEFVSREFVELGTRLACAEMIRSGVTTFADMYYFEDSVAQATASAGMRAICAQTILKFPSPDAQSYDEAFTATRKFIQKWKGHPLIVPAVGPHAPYTCTDEILQMASALAIEFDVPLHIHISETALEVENMRREMGMPVVPYIKKQNVLEAKVIAAHCVHIDEGEMRTMKHTNASIIHNPTSNIKLASGIAKVKKMLELGLNVGIGTDGSASNNDLDMFEEIRLAAFLSKVDSNDPTALPAPQALLMATRMGAQALHLGEITGSLEPGKRADLICMDIDRLHYLPRFHRDPKGIYAQIVYAGKSNDVADVMINGKWVMRDRELLTLDENELAEKSQNYARQIDAFLLDREESVIAKLIAIGGATQEESFEVQVKVRLDSLQPVLDALNNPALEIIRKRHYIEYDTYFSFTDPDQGYLRYREDQFIDESGQTTNVRSRLTHIGVTDKEEFSSRVLLSRSRYIAPATQSLRFYREYFKPASEQEIEKDRLRFLVQYFDTEFFINLDTVKKPLEGYFLEIKSRTWSRKDAIKKGALVLELLNLLAPDQGDAIHQDYIHLISAEDKPHNV